MIIGIYHPGNSLIHRCPAGPKLVALVVALALTLRFPLLALGPAIGLYAIARIRFQVAFAQIRPLWPILVMVGGFQGFSAGPWRAAEVTVGLAVSVALAGLVTLTTKISVMLETLASAARPLRRVGVDPDRVALLLALTIRCVPLLVDIVRKVREAQLARGAGRNPFALAVPVVVQALRASDALGEALAARGFDD